ncbi:MAG TPA: glycosyltransferase [Caulobacteraceae bacterium]|nr:glycosyltransferase [Caulobacteraceae bacterium]
MRLLNVGDFHWMTGAEQHTANLSLFDIRRKFSHAAVRANDLVVEFSDRAVARAAAPLGLRSLGGRTADRRFLQVVDELRPDLILLHFADDISNEALAQARRLSPGVTIADINIDPIWTPKNWKRLSARKGVADALFVTTAEPGLAEHVAANAFAAFLPNPVDPAVETGRAFENDAPDFDLLFPATDEEPRDVGSRLLEPALATALLKSDVPGLRLLAPGVGDEPPARGAAYFDALQSARIGWSLSRRSNLPLYASDRMAHFFGWGLAVCLDRRSGFDRFYDPSEAVFYDELADLAAAVRRLIADDARARAMARRGWEKTWTVFHMDRVYAYVLAQLFDDGGARDYEWPCERWC